MIDVYRAIDRMMPFAKGVSAKSYDFDSAGPRDHARLRPHPQDRHRQRLPRLRRHRVRGQAAAPSPRGSRRRSGCSNRSGARCTPRMSPADASAAQAAVAAVITEWRTNSHADVILSRLLEPEAWGHARPFALRLAAVYADQFPENDLCRALCPARRPDLPDGHRGGRRRDAGVPVEGVILVGEHGQYATNSRGQKLYPRRRLFDEVVHAFRVLGRRVPVFTDKHLSYDWLFARWMYDLARHEGIPLHGRLVAARGLAGPRADTCRSACELTRAFAPGLRRPRRLRVPRPRDVAVHGRTPPGGETGVASVRCRVGPGGLGGGRVGPLAARPARRPRADPAGRRTPSAHAVRRCPATRSS